MTPRAASSSTASIGNGSWSHPLLPLSTTSTAQRPTASSSPRGHSTRGDVFRGHTHTAHRPTGPFRVTAPPRSAPVEEAQRRTLFVNANKDASNRGIVHVYIAGPLPSIPPPAPRCDHRRCAASRTIKFAWQPASQCWLRLSSRPRCQTPRAVGHTITPASLRATSVLHGKAVRTLQ